MSLQSLPTPQHLLPVARASPLENSEYKKWPRILQAIELYSNVYPSAAPFPES
ncbi:hypothetical protein CES86_3493 [Brucella lupini]|uniref:Uncharacterized protein n=1 Tax=Brucella lupini TaxID=255457 RepID=A0A256GJ68_9HYPH|nr:hypothetical protein CES86_3493 [Brucella lupini]